LSVEKRKMKEKRKKKNNKKPPLLPLLDPTPLSTPPPSFPFYSF
jgi:hypothetical protein